MGSKPMQQAPQLTWANEFTKKQICTKLER